MPKEHLARAALNAAQVTKTDENLQNELPWETQENNSLVELVNIVDTRGCRLLCLVKAVEGLTSLWPKFVRE